MLDHLGAQQIVGMEKNAGFTKRRSAQLTLDVASPLCAIATVRRDDGWMNGAEEEEEEEAVKVHRTHLKFSRSSKVLLSSTNFQNTREMNALKK